MSAADTTTPLTAVEEIAWRLDRIYLSVRAYVGPLYERRSRLPRGATADISRDIFELGVNAAYGWYRLLEVEVQDPEAAMRLARRLLHDSRLREAQIRRETRSAWRRIEDLQYVGGPPVPRGSRRSRFKMHRQYRPTVFGGQRRSAA